MTLLLAALLVASDPAVAAQQPSQDPKATQTATSEKAEKAEKKICRREESTESRLGAKRICLTAEEWRARDSGM